MTGRKGRFRCGVYYFLHIIQLWPGFQASLTDCPKKDPSLVCMDLILLKFSFLYPQTHSSPYPVWQEEESKRRELGT